MVYLFKWMDGLSRTRNKTDLAVQNFIIPSKGKRHIFDGFELDAQTLNTYILKTAIKQLHKYLHFSMLLSRCNKLINFFIGRETNYN